jgi:hypothetical protein
MSRTWTDDEIKKLTLLREQGASATRAALALKSNKTAVRAKARELGIPFPTWHAQKAERQTREAAARVKAGLPQKPL